MAAAAHRRADRAFAARHGVASTGQLRRAGLSDRQIERLCDSGALELVHPGVVRSPAAPASWTQAVMAATLAVPGSLAARRTAAVLWRLDGSRRGRIEVVVRRWERRHRTAYVVHETLDLAVEDRAEVDGMPVTSPVRTLVDLAAVLPFERLVQALDDAERRGLVVLPAVERRFAQLAKRGRPGTRRFRTALGARSGAVPESDFSRRAVRILVDAGLPEPALEHEVQRPDGVVVRLDLAYPARRVGIEFDGRSAHGATRFQGDRTRQNELVLAGWTILRFTWRDLEERPDHLVAVVRAALALPA